MLLEHVEWFSTCTTLRRVDKVVTTLQRENWAGTSRDLCFCASRRRY